MTQRSYSLFARRRRGVISALCACVFGTLWSAPLTAQQIPGLDLQRSFTIDRIDADHWKLTGEVEVEHADMKFYADEVEYFSDTGRLIAIGNVVFTQGGNRISADRADFNAKTKLGTFHNATGISVITGPQIRSMFGTQEPDVYFYGETIEKIAYKKYRITRGGFTTCVQPTPRWELISGTVILNLDHYTLLRNSLLKVKGVPMLYLPVFYYPTKKDDRATGFLLPAYGSSTIRGQSLSNAFFWAIDRSQDATVLHDWFSNTGQGLGGEYRYAAAAGSQGNARAYFLNEHEALFTSRSGNTTTRTSIPARRSYQIRADVSQALGSIWRATGRVDYFSSLAVQQTYQTNIYDASLRQRTYGGNVSGSWSAYSLTGTYDRSEYFFGDTGSTLNGGTPRISFGRGEQPLLGTPVYVSFTSEYVNVLRQSRSGTTAIDDGLGRLEVTPLVRYPLTRWPFLTVNSSAAMRETYWTQSRNPVTGTRVAEGISRRYYDFQSHIVGPVFSRIWNTENGYAEKIKHTIEPYLTLQRTTAIDNDDRFVKLEGSDFAVGETTRYAYGVNNRVFAKRRGLGPAASALEILNVSIGQTYYTNALSAQADRQYQTSFSGAPPSHFSPISLVVRAVPTDRTNATLTAEFDSRYYALRTIAASGMAAIGDHVQTTAGWSARKFIKELAGFDDPARLDQFLNQTTTVQTRDNRIGGLYSFNWDILHGALLQQRVVGYYNAQCCGFSLEYQAWNLAGLGSSPVPQDRRFTFAFTLAGIGSFSPFFGALSGAPGAAR